jgi:tetratricopeptide (TPR) repeat protein
MDKEIILWSIVYVALFRLAIIAVGVVGIVLGYRLFCRGVWVGVDTGQGTALEADIAGSRFTLKNAAPGTCFALFGVVLISIMLAKGPPEVALPDGTTADKEREIMIRNNKKNTVESLIEQGNRYWQNQETDKAVGPYREAVALVVLPMNNLAWHYQAQRDFEKSLALARMAVMMGPDGEDRAEFLDTLAVILCKTGQRDEAVSRMEEAARLKEKFRDKVQKLQQGSCA